MKKLARINNLEVKFRLPNKQSVHALNGINIDINENETLGLIGESGSGKSTLGKALLGLVKYEGNINLFQKDLDLGNKLLIRNTRKDIGVVFQEPFLSLNPRMKINRRRHRFEAPHLSMCRRKPALPCPIARARNHPL